MTQAWKGWEGLLSPVPLLKYYHEFPWLTWLDLMIKSHSFSFVFKTFFLWWLEYSYSPLSVFTGSSLLLCQQPSCSLDSSSVAFISMGYLDTATMFCVSLCPVKLNKTRTPHVLLSKQAFHVPGQFSSLPLHLFPCEFGFLEKGWPELWVMLPLPSSDKLL